MSKYHDDLSHASDALALTLSEPLLRALQPQLFGLRSLFVRMRWGKKRLSAGQVRQMLREHLATGDSRAALVVHIEPRLIVAAYTDEQDAVLLCEFPLSLVNQFKLKPGTRLLTINTYGRGPRMMADIVIGPASTGRYQNYYPVIAEFVSPDRQAIEDRKRSIPEDEWRRAAAMAAARLTTDLRPRDGRPLYSNRPRT